MWGKDAVGIEGMPGMLVAKRAFECRCCSLEEIFVVFFPVNTINQLEKRRMSAHIIFVQDFALFLPYEGLRWQSNSAPHYR